MSMEGRTLEQQAEYFYELASKEPDPAVKSSRIRMAELFYIKHADGLNGSAEKVEVIMGDKYDISGQTGAVGPNAHAHDINFNQIWNQVQGSIDLPKLVSDLSALRQQMKKEAVEPEHDIAVSEVARAEQAAKGGDGSKTLEHLKSAGKWALDIATKIGTSLAVEAIKASMGPG